MGIPAAPGRDLTALLTNVAQRHLTAHGIGREQSRAVIQVLSKTDAAGAGEVLRRLGEVASSAPDRARQMAVQIARSRPLTPAKTALLERTVSLAQGPEIARAVADLGQLPMSEALFAKAATLRGTDRLPLLDTVRALAADRSAELGDLWALTGGSPDAMVAARDLDAAMSTATSTAPPIGHEHGTTDPMAEAQTRAPSWSRWPASFACLLTSCAH
ncbi:MAG: hypothetical protein KTR31_04215 [Myxococcales bacterium]|nr:hypothetical protein [Myxococcales bacterium]